MSEQPEDEQMNTAYYLSSELDPMPLQMCGLAKLHTALNLNSIVLCVRNVKSLFFNKPTKHFHGMNLFQKVFRSFLITLEACSKYFSPSDLFFFLKLRFQVGITYFLLFIAQKVALMRIPDTLSSQIFFFSPGFNSLAAIAL